MMHVPEHPMGERSVAHSKWGAPIVGIHSVGDTHFGDTQFGDTRSVQQHVPEQHVASALTHRALEPVKMPARRLHLPRDPDATPIYAPDAALLQALQPESRLEPASPHYSASLHHELSASSISSRAARRSDASPLGTVRPRSKALCGRARKIPSPVLGVVLGGLIGLISALSIHLHKQRTRAPQASASQTAGSPQAVEQRAVEQRALKSVDALPARERIQTSDGEVKVTPGLSEEVGPSSADLASRALSHHFAGSCREAIELYRQLERKSSQPSEKKMWQELAQASERTCAAATRGASP